jgi:hypothetical protein
MPAFKAATPTPVLDSTSFVSTVGTIALSPNLNNKFSPLPAKLRTNYMTLAFSASAVIKVQREVRLVMVK